MGVFVTTSIFASVYYFHGSAASSYVDEAITAEEALQILENENYTVLTNQEHNNLMDEITHLEEEINVLMELEEEVENGQTSPEEEIESPEAEEESTETVYEAVLIIESGMTTRNIADQLEYLNIISDSRAFERYVQESGLERALRMGEFNLTSDMTIQEVAQTLSSP